MENQHTDMACDNQDRNGITSRTPAHQSTHRSVQKCSIQWELNFVDNNKIESTNCAHNNIPRHSQSLKHEPEQLQLITDADKAAAMVEQQRRQQT